MNMQLPIVVWFSIFVLIVILLFSLACPIRSIIINIIIIIYYLGDLSWCARRKGGRQFVSSLNNANVVIIWWRIRLTRQTQTKKSLAWCLLMNEMICFSIDSALRCTSIEYRWCRCDKMRSLGSVSQKAKTPCSMLNAEERKLLLFNWRWQKSKEYSAH